jgi:hypothetical protein
MLVVAPGAHIPTGGLRPGLRLGRADDWPHAYAKWKSLSVGGPPTGPPLLDQLSNPQVASSSKEVHDPLTCGPYVRVRIVESLGDNRWCVLDKVISGKGLIPPLTEQALKDWRNLLRRAGGRFLKDLSKHSCRIEIVGLQRLEQMR